jgi:hypothetical protein
MPEKNKNKKTSPTKNKLQQLCKPQSRALKNAKGQRSESLATLTRELSQEPRKR